MNRLLLKTLLFLAVFSTVGTKLSAQNLSLVSKTTYDNQNMSSIWGYTSPEGKEYALVGTTKGMSIVDISIPETPQEVHFVNGVEGPWREIKTYGHYAYITHDNSSENEGILIVDLQNIGESITVKDFRGLGGLIRRAHTLYIDSLGFLYVYGGSVSGCAIYDLKVNPLAPTYVGKTSTEYIHDGYVRGDTLWASNVYAGTLSIWDLKDRRFPVKIAQFNTPRNFTHNAWLSDNGEYLFTTDEVAAAPVGVYNVKDISDIQLVDQFKIKSTEQSIPHNVHVLNDFLIISHYTEGVVIADALDPNKVIKSGQYDTSPFSGGGFFGCWGVYPYFPSGLIVASDIEQGLFVLRPTYERGSRVYGKVVDSISGLPINQATVKFFDNNSTTNTNFDGEFKLGRMNEGNFNLQVDAEGYFTQIESVQLVKSETADVTIKLLRRPTAINDNQLSDWVSTVVLPQDLRIELNVESAVLNVINSMGQTVLETQTLAQGTNVIDWSKLSSGVYLIDISTIDKRTSLKVFKN